MTTLGILHPGSMGAAVAAQARLAGAEVLWCPDGRGSGTVERAQKYGLTPVDGLRELVERADVILSLCPPAAAVDIARSVAAHGYSRVYVDANAVSPATMASVGEVLEVSGATVVDGSVIGSPPSASKSPRLYLSGPAEVLPSVAELFTGTAVQTRLLSGGVGRASALKLSYSTYQKTSRVLAAVSYALAREYGVEEELVDVAQGRTTSYLAEVDYFPKAAARAWRWGPEMEEAAESLAEIGLPSDLTVAAASVLSRWESFKDASVDLAYVLDALHGAADGEAT